jgi:hypothetical protein
MLAEKFMLLLEALRTRDSYADGSPRVISTSPHVPVQLPAGPTNQVAVLRGKPGAPFRLDAIARCFRLELFPVLSVVGPP